MSADNGYILRNNRAGKYVLQHYFVSSGYPDLENAHERDIFQTLDEALAEYQERDSDSLYRSEYGLSVHLDPLRLSHRSSNGKA